MLEHLGQANSANGGNNGDNDVNNANNANSDEVDTTERDEYYPRLSYRAKSNVRRCSLCVTKVASFMSYGHPLSDEVSLVS